MKRELVIFTLLVMFMTSNSLAFEFCEEGITGEDKIRLIAVDDMLKGNTKEWTWENSEEIELEMRVENKEDKSGTFVIEAVFIEDDDDEIVAEDEDNLKIEFELSGEERKSVSMEFDVDDDVKKGEYDLYIKFYKKGNEDETCVENSEETVKIEKIEICSEEVDDDELKIIEITDEMDDNDKEWVWYPGDDIEVSVEVENKDYTERDFVIELIMLNEEKEEIGFAEDETRKELELEEDERETATFNFDLNKNLEKGEYRLYAKFYDKDDKDNCKSLRAESKNNKINVKIEKEENKVKIKGFTGPKKIEKGEELNFKVEVQNIGSEDEEKVRVIAYNRNLGLNEIKEIDDLESGQSKEINFDFTMPTEINKTKQTILFSLEYKYDDKKEFYDEFEDEEEIRYMINIEEAKIKETKQEESNITEENEIDENKTRITGAAINNPKSKSGFLTFLIVLLGAIVVGAIIYLTIKRKNKQPLHIHLEPRVSKKYKARLN